MKIVDGMRVPDFFIVGAPKCGTTSLQHYLDQHPDVAMLKGEPHTFASAKVKNYCNNMRGKKQFSCYENNLSVLLGEKSVNYIYSDRDLFAIKNANKEAKIIFMIREYSEFLVSLHYQYMRMFKLKYDFCTFFNFFPLVENLYRLEIDFRLPQNNSILLEEYLYLFKDSFFRMCLYSKYLSRLIYFFGVKNLKVIIYNDFISNPHKITNDVCIFLGLRELCCEKKHIDFKIKNKGHIVKYKVLEDIYKFFEKIVGNINNDFVKYILKDIMGLKYIRDFNKRDYPQISTEIKEKIRKSYLRDCIKLSDMLDRDLVSEWRMKI